MYALAQSSDRDVPSRLTVLERCNSSILSKFVELITICSKPAVKSATGAVVCN